MQPLPTLNNLLQIDLPYIYPFQNSKKSHHTQPQRTNLNNTPPTPIVPKLKKTSAPSYRRVVEEPTS